VRILPLKPRVKNTHSIVSSNSGSASIIVPFNVGYDLDLAAQDVQNRAQNALAQLPSEVVQQGVSITKQATDFTLAVNAISPDGRYDDAFLSNYADLHIGDVLRRMYVNDFNKFGRLYRVFLQTTEDFRSSPEDISCLYVRTSAGDMVPLSALIQVRPVVGPRPFRILVSTARPRSMARLQNGWHRAACCVTLGSSLSALRIQRGRWQGSPTNVAHQQTTKRKDHATSVGWTSSNSYNRYISGVIRMSTSNHWLVCPKPSPHASLRLFCFPYAGGGSVIYRSWTAGLPETTELWCIRLPGRESFRAEQPFTQLVALVEALAPVILPYLDVPFAFFGHSMGGLLSFELTHELHRQHNLVPVHLFIAGHRAPQLPDQTPALHHLPESELLIQLRRLNGTPQAVLQDAELMQFFLPLLRADFAVCETYTYTPKPPLLCPISVFGGIQDPRVSHDELAAWREQTCSAFIHRMLPGDHFFLHSAQALLLHALTQDLAQDMNTSGI